MGTKGESLHERNSTWVPKVLQWAEAAASELDDAALNMISWAPLPTANSQLYDLLVTITEGDAQGMVLSSPDRRRCGKCARVGREYVGT